MSLISLSFLCVKMPSRFHVMVPYPLDYFSLMGLAPKVWKSIYGKRISRERRENDINTDDRNWMLLGLHRCVGRR